MPACRGDAISSFIKGKVPVIGCPKLEAVDHTEKLTAVIRGNDIRSVTIVRMEVPCCGGLLRAAENALRGSGLGDGQGRIEKLAKGAKVVSGRRFSARASEREFREWVAALGLE